MLKSYDIEMTEEEHVANGKTYNLQAILVTDDDVFCEFCRKRFVAGDKFWFCNRRKFAYCNKRECDAVHNLRINGVFPHSDSYVKLETVGANYERKIKKSRERRNNRAESEDF